LAAADREQPTKTSLEPWIWLPHLAQLNKRDFLPDHHEAHARAIDHVAFRSSIEPLGRDGKANEGHVTRR
jgi:hypothetical protein